MEDLIREYKESLEKVREAKKTASPEDRRTLAGMERNLVETIRMMEGRQPEHRDYVTRRSNKQIEEDVFGSRGSRYAPYGLKPPEWFDGVTEEGEASIYDHHPAPIGGPGYYLCDEEEDFAQAALAQLTEKQREAYLLHHLEGLSEREVAKHLGITKNAARDRIQGAQKKIDRWIKETIPPAVMAPQKTYELYGPTTEGYRPTLERFRAWMKGEYKDVLGETHYGLESGFDEWLWGVIQTGEKISPEGAKNTDHEPHIYGGEKQVFCAHCVRHCEQ